MPLMVRYSVILEVTDNQLTNFKTPQIANSTTTDFTQELGATVLIPAGTINYKIDSQGIDQLQMVFILADQDLEVKLVPTGGSLGATPGLTLMANKPNLISVRNIQEIYLSNSTSQAAKLTLQALGNDLP